MADQITCFKCQQSCHSEPDLTAGKCRAIQNLYQNIVNSNINKGDDKEVYV